MEVLSNIIEWFKKVFRIKPIDKSLTEIDSDYDVVNDLSVTATLSERLTTLATVDSSISIVGDTKRAQYLNKLVKWIDDTKLSIIGQICLGTGDCIVKPNTNGKRIGIDIIKNKDFIIVECVGDFLLSVLIKCETIKKNNKIYERWEYHKLDEYEGKSFVAISQYAFVDGKQVSLNSIESWSNMQERTIIPNVDRLLMGRFKCPKVNRNDINSANGVPITSGAEEIVRQIKASYRRFNNEFEKMEPMIFADKRIFKVSKVKNAQGATVEKSLLPKGKERVVMGVNGGNSVDSAPMIKEWAPNIRDASLETAIERNFRMLELFCGLSEGILSKSTLTYTNTDEVKKSTQATFAFITNFRKVLERGITDLVYAIDIVANYNMITPMGTYNINFDWSDSFVESMQERFNQMLQSLNMDAISKAEFRSWVMSEPIEIAEENIAKIEGQEDDFFNDDNEIIKAKKEVENEVGKTLNGAQTQSLLAVMEQYTEGQLTLNQAVNILTVSIGVTKDEAKNIIQGIE